MLEVAIAAFNLAIYDGVLPASEEAVPEAETASEPVKEAENQ